MLKAYFLAGGRADRIAFWRAIAVIGILLQVATLAFVLIGIGLLGLSPLAISIGSLVVLAIAAWAGVAIGIRRLHDRSHSGWWILLAFVPLVGTLWHLIANGCLAGTPGPNRYGIAPDGVAPAVTAVFGDDDGQPARAGRRRSVTGTILLWVLLLVVTAITVLLFQNPNPKPARHASLDGGAWAMAVASLRRQVISARYAEITGPIRRMTSG